MSSGYNTPPCCSCFALDAQPLCPAGYAWLSAPTSHCPSSLQKKISPPQLCALLQKHPFQKFKSSWLYFQVPLANSQRTYTHPFSIFFLCRRPTPFELFFSLIDCSTPYSYFFGAFTLVFSPFQPSSLLKITPDIVTIQLCLCLLCNTCVSVSVVSVLF